MKNNQPDPLWRRYGLNRRSFLRRFGIASSAITFSPFFIDRWSSVCRGANNLVRVYKVKNGDCFQNTAKLWEMVGGPAKYIGPGDIVVIKANGQWPNQGYTHTGCIKGVIDKVLGMPGFAGEILICDNVQNYGTAGCFGFDATPEYRINNWPDHNWNSLAAQYQANGKAVATKNWKTGSEGNCSAPGYCAWNPENGEGWARDLFQFHGSGSLLSYPVFESPLTRGRMIDLRNGVWEHGIYTGQKVKTIFMPNLNNHGSGDEDFAGVTSAIKCFFGATEMRYVDGYSHIHDSSFSRGYAQYAGELVGRYINTLWAPILYITAAMWSGNVSRTSTSAAETKTVLACANPVTLDYVSCREVISLYSPWLNPDQDNNTRKQILGCMSQGIGTIDPTQFEVITYDFNNPTANRLDVERKIRDFKQGKASEQDVKDTVNLYMESK